MQCVKQDKVFFPDYTMGNGISNLVNFELLKEMQKEGATIIHTMDENEKVLIVGTVVAEKESDKINKMLSVWISKRYVIQLHGISLLRKHPIKRLISQKLISLSCTL